MSDNGKLIEEAAKALEEQSPMRYSRWPDWVWTRLARAAFAVFEKAQTPTDDEREALVKIIDEAYPYTTLGGGLVATADRILNAGFRRSET